MAAGSVAVRVIRGLGLRGACRAYPHDAALEVEPDEPGALAAVVRLVDALDPGSAEDATERRHGSSVGRVRR